jgi:medium-chain acyl-[acyl-carrier-protein] hydrolase
MEPPFTRLGPLIEALTTALLPHLDKPFAFFGHSLGAIVSFEVVRRLQAEYGLEPRHLFVSAHRAPQIPDPDPPTYNLPEPELIEELKRLSGTPPEILQNDELMRLMLPLLRADFELVQTYSYVAGPPLNCPISAFGGLRDQEVSREQLKAWREHTNASFALRMFPGDHFFIHTAEQLLLTTISKELNQNLP